MIGLLATVILFPLAGIAFARLFGPASIFLAGVGSVGFLLFIAGILHVPIAWALVAIAIAAMAIIVKVKGNPEERPAPSIVLAAFGAILLFVAAIVPLADYDGRAFWIPKAKAIAVENAIDGPFFHGERGDWARSHYPLLLPLDGAAVMMVARDIDDREVRWLYALIPIALAFEVRRRFGTWIAIIILALPKVAIAPDGALSAYADLAVGAFVACALFELIDGESAARLGMWAAFVALTKNEGLPLAMLLVAIGAIVFRRRVVAALPQVAIAIAALLVWRTRVPRFDEDDFVQLIQRIGDHVGRFAQSFAILARETLSLSHWGLFWIAAIAAAVFLAARRDARPLAIAAAIALPMLVLYAAVFAVTPWPLAMLEDDLAPRLLTHLCGVAIILFGGVVRPPR